ncbi:MAG: hypothetical protein ACO1SX_02840 [Actinomycetota bacterium]
MSGKALTSSCSQADGIVLFHPRQPWYAENAPEMIRLLQEMKGQLQEGLRLSGPRDIMCLVTDPKWALERLGVAGLAMNSLILVTCPERCMSEFARTAGHELAHVLSRSAGEHETPFKCEGFACYAAEVIDADTRPFGMPLHFHLVWMLSVGLRPTLAELWRRQDYTAELYDLGWSFTTFLVERYGLERYYCLYRAVDEPLETRLGEAYGLSSSQLEREWYAVARASIDVDPAAMSRMGRGAGGGCSRAKWLSGRS